MLKIDVESDKLRDILRRILRDIHSISIREFESVVGSSTFYANFPLKSISQLHRNLPYHFLPELEAYQSELDNNVGHNVAETKHLNLFVNFLKSKHTSTDRSSDFASRKRLNYI